MLWRTPQRPQVLEEYGEALRFFHCTTLSMRNDNDQPNTSLTPSPTQSPRTVAYFDHTAKLGGGEIALLLLLRHIDRARFAPLVILGEDGPLRKRLEDADIETIVLPLDARVAQTRKDSLQNARALKIEQAASTLKYAVHLGLLVRKRGAWLLHTNSLKADVIGAFAARVARVPVLWHVRDRIADDYLPAKAARLFRLACRILPDAIAVNSYSTLESLRLPDPPPPWAHVVHNGFVEPQVHVVHDGFVEPSAQPQGEERHKGPLIGLVGRISPWKGQDVFIRAAARVREEFPGARFQIIGSPLFGEEDYEAEVRELSRTLHLDEAMEFTGFVSDVEGAMARLDILVHASTMPEPFGQVVMEAMALSLPVIATRGGGVVEIVEDGKTAFLVPMGDADAMAEAILVMLRDPARAREMGAAGRERVSKHFTIEQTAARVEAVYDQIQESRRRRARPKYLGVAVLMLLWLLKRRK
jgi:glycosyltransferase involved in cell wall biosynthesis